MKKIGSPMMILLVATVCLMTSPASAEPQEIPFDGDNWQLFGGTLVDHLGKQSLKGSAQLRGIEFEDGIIEFDVSVTGARSYPGIRFRAQSAADAENIYIRPHILGVGDNALQYTPIFNRSACWQLYYGENYNSGLDIPVDEWVHVKIEVSGQQARVYIGDGEEAVLKVEHLKHGLSRGGIALVAPADGSAHFSSFSIDLEAKPEFEPPLPEEMPPGVITDWEISQPFKYSRIDLEKHYSKQDIPEIEWKKVEVENSGLVNLSKSIARVSREPDFIFARTTIESDHKSRKHFNIGYSDWVVVFLNGVELFSGSSPYQGRGRAFQGIIGFYDALVLPLEKGENELVLIVGESFGGWGFMAQDAKEVYMAGGLEEIWKSDRSFTTSESVLYDPEREILYVTNFDQYNVGDPRVQQSISRMSLDGKVEELKWIDGLDNPLGITIHDGRLFTAERNAVAEIDIDEGKVIKRHAIEGSVFLNDLAIDGAGDMYITDSRKNVIWKYSDGKAEEWLSGEEVLDPNVIYIEGNTLFFGNSGDQRLKSVDTRDRSVRHIARFETGFIDGFRPDGRGNYLVSLWRGKLYRVSPDGEKTRLLDTTTFGDYIADFEYIVEKDLLVVPNFIRNTVTAYSLK